MDGSQEPISMITDSRNMSNLDPSAETSLKLEDDHIKKRSPSLAAPMVDWKQFVQIFIAEVVATALLMCLGCMGGIVGFGGSDKINQLQPALVFGFTVCSLITSFGHISGAHMNPAVTVCFYMMGTIDAIQVPIYIVAEVIGSVLGIGILLLLTPASIIGTKAVCVTVPDPSLNDFQAFGIEFICTSLLLLVLLGCSDIRNAEKQDSVPLKFAAVIITLSLLGGPYTGASLNPARTFGPALWSKDWTSHWVYWIGPLLAGLICPLFYQTCFPPSRK